jgi:hypothetical protein
MPHTEVLVLLFAVVTAVTVITYWRLVLKLVGVGAVALIAYGAYSLATIVQR